MNNKTENYRKYIFLAITIIALGITFNTSLKDKVGVLGIVLIAVGGFLFIVGMSMKQKEQGKIND